MLSLAPEGRVKGMLFWLMGDASSATRPWPALALLAVGLAAALPFARELNLLARGEVTARALGVRVGRLRGLVYGLGSLLTAVAVTTVGSVGFVGLIVPHLVRLAIGNDQRLLLPAATLAGGVLLCAADTAARTVVAPIQLPVGAHRADRRAGVPVPAGEASAMKMDARPRAGRRTAHRAGGAGRVPRARLHAAARRHPGDPRPQRRRQDHPAAHPGRPARCRPRRRAAVRPALRRLAPRP
jgi:hypothetical protein